MAKLGTLMSSFNYLGGGPWAVGYSSTATYSTGGGQLTMNIPANTVSGYMQVNTWKSGTGYIYWDLTESAVVVQVASAGTQHATIELWCPQLVDSAGNWFGWHIINGQIQVNYGGGVRASATYVPATHQWLRIRETGGSTYYDYSPDSFSWTNLYTIADSNDKYCLAAVYPNLYLGSNSSGTNPAASAVFDSFNMPALPVQIPNYAIANNLPAPVTTGSTIQSFIDVNGEQWIAKNGVQGGQWRRARDVLHAQIYRSATGLNCVVSPGAVIAFDATVKDDWGLYRGASFYGLTAPLTGWYLARANLQIVVAAASQYVQGWLQQNTGVSNATVVQWSSDNYFSARASGGLLWRSAALMYLTANDIVNLKAFCSTQYGITNNANVTRLELAYMGSG